MVSFGMVSTTKITVQCREIIWSILKQNISNLIKLKYDSFKVPTLSINIIATYFNKIRLLNNYNLRQNLIIYLTPINIGRYKYSLPLKFIEY